MKGLFSVVWLLFIIVLNKCESIETGTFVNLFRTRRQALDQSALPEGYKIFPDHNVAYKFYEEELTWDAARGKCKSDGGDLAIALRADTIQFIQGSIVPTSSNYYVLVGIYKPAGSWIWRTVEETQLLTEAMPWNGEPSSTVGVLEKCATADLHEGELYWDVCFTARPFVCEIPTCKQPRVAEVTTTTTPATTTLISTLPPPPLPPLPTKATTSDHFPLQSVEFPRLGISYKLHGDRLTHHEARERCFSDGGQLAVVDSFKKINVISKILDEESVHVGIRVSSVNFEEWVGDSDGKPLKDLPWTADNPHLAKCVALRQDGSGLEETLCSNRLQYLCESLKIF